VCKQTVNTLYTWYSYLLLIYIPCTIFTSTPTLLHSAYLQESVPLLIDIDQDQDASAATTYAEKRLVQLLPLEIWHTIIEYLEGNNNFLNTVLARILIPSARVRQTIITSFNSYLAHASPEQRIKTLKLFYTTVRYASEHNILGRTAHVTQALIPAVTRHNFNYACTQVPALVSLPKEHALYLIDHCSKLAKNYSVQEQLQAPSTCQHGFYSTLGIVLVFLSIVGFTQDQQLENNYKISATLFSIAVIYWFCYGFTLCNRAYHLSALDKFLYTLEEHVQLINLAQHN